MYEAYLVIARGCKDSAWYCNLILMLCDPHSLRGRVRTRLMPGPLNALFWAVEAQALMSVDGTTMLGGRELTGSDIALGGFPPPLGISL